ncbi:MAG: hypothetical protein ABIO49_14780 [Dokdonella sp.]
MKATSSAASLQPSGVSLFRAQAFVFVTEHGIVLEASRCGAIAALGLPTEIAGTA